MTRTCSDCPASISAKGKTGRCQRCSARKNLENLCANPEIMAKRGRSISRMHKDPAFAARFSASCTTAKAKTMQDPAYAARISELGRTVGRFNISACHTPEARHRHRVSLIPWCPPEHWDLNRHLRKSGFVLAERKAIILAMVPGTIEHARRTIANNNDIMRIKEERRKAQAY